MSIRNAVIFLRDPSGRLLAGGREQDHEIRMIGVADEVLGAVDHEVAARFDGRGLHAAHVGSRAGLRHRQAFGTLAAHRGQEIALALLAGQASRMFDGRPTQDQCSA
jgi:hypothetical protein